MDDKKDISTSYHPPEVFKKLDDVVGPDVVLEFHDGQVRFHSIVISESSRKMRQFFDIQSVKSSPYRLDLRHLCLIHGAIVKKLLYEGLMHEAVDPVKSNLPVKVRLDLLVRSREMIESLGLTRILNTITSWIEPLREIVHIELPEDTKTISLSSEAHSVETISSESSDVFSSSPITDLTHDFKYRPKSSSLPQDDNNNKIDQMEDEDDDDDVMAVDDSASNYESDEPSPPSPAVDQREMIPASSDDEEEAFLDQPEGSGSESEESSCQNEIKTEPTDVPKDDIPVGSLRSPSPVSIRLLLATELTN